MRYPVVNMAVEPGLSKYGLGSYPLANLGSGESLGQYEYGSENLLTQTQKAYQDAVKTGDQAKIEKAFGEYKKAYEAWEKELPLQKELEDLAAENWRDMSPGNYDKTRGEFVTKDRIKERLARMEELWPGWHKAHEEYWLWQSTGGLPQWYRDLQAAGASALEIAIQVLPFLQQARGMRIPRIQAPKFQPPQFKAPVPTTPMRPAVPTPSQPKITYPMPWAFSEAYETKPAATITPPPKGVIMPTPSAGPTTPTRPAVPTPSQPKITYPMPVPFSEAYETKPAATPPTPTPGPAAPVQPGKPVTVRPPVVTPAIQPPTLSPTVTPVGPATAEMPPWLLKFDPAVRRLFATWAEGKKGRDFFDPDQASYWTEFLYGYAKEKGYPRPIVPNWAKGLPPNVFDQFMRTAQSKGLSLNELFYEGSGDMWRQWALKDGVKAGLLPPLQTPKLPPAPGPINLREMVPPALRPLRPVPTQPTYPVPIYDKFKIIPERPGMPDPWTSGDPLYKWYQEPQSMGPTPTPTPGGGAPCPSGQFPAYPGGPCRDAVARGSLPALPGSMLTGSVSPENRFPLSRGLGTRVLGG